jgi:3-oxoacid CoA-transferase A subunit
MDKTVKNVHEALSGVEDGATIAIGGFFAAGVPRILLRALAEKGTKNLTLACGSGPLLGAKEELSALLEKRQIKKVIDSYGLFRSATKGAQHPFEQQVRAGEIEFEVYPMGTLCEKYRMAGAGIPASFIPVGAGSMVEDTTITNIEENRKKREARVIDGQTCILEYALKPDFALVHANAGDPEGNLCYRKTAWNFNHVMAMAARVTIAEVENLVSPGDLKPESVHTPGIFVKRILQVPRIKFDITAL